MLYSIVKLINLIAYFVASFFLSSLLLKGKGFISIIIAIVVSIIYLLVSKLDIIYHNSNYLKFFSYFSVMMMATAFAGALTLFISFFIKGGLNRVLEIRSIPLTILLISLGIGVYTINSAETIRVTSYNIELNKGKGRADELKIVFFSDLHLGDLIKAGRLKELVTKVGYLKADLVLIGGDLFDKGLYGFTKGELDEIKEELKRLRSPLGVFFINGNHEYYGFDDINKVESFIEGAGISNLNNKSLVVDGIINLIGYDDRDSYSSQNLNKVKLEKKDSDLATIILIHRPIDSEVLKEGDLVLSGHTHKGQIFPANYLMEAHFKNIYGLKEMNGYKSLVSSGAGYWLLPMRLFSKSEILEINITFK